MIINTQKCIFLNAVIFIHSIVSKKKCSLCLTRLPLLILFETVFSRPSWYAVLNRALKFQSLFETGHFTQPAPKMVHMPFLVLPRWLSGKEPAYQCRARGLDPRVEKMPWRHGNLIQYSCLGNPMDRGAWRATVRGMTKET